jgi:signal transduction histidine kinase/ligand-binding sensor domain-containing protein
MVSTRIPLSALIIGVILLLTAPAVALDTASEVGQYGHTAWTLHAGNLPAYPKTIAQTPDGYLWLGTESGMLRFDGVRFTRWQPSRGRNLPSTNITQLLVTRDGGLWIGTAKGLARWEHESLTEYSDLAGQYVTSLVEDRGATVWVGTSAPDGFARLCALQRETRRCHGGDGTLGRFVTTLEEDSAGNLWVGAATGLWRWNLPSPTRYQVPYSFPEVHSVVEGSNGAILVAINREIRQLVDQTLQPYPLIASDRQLKPTSLLRDRDGGLWVGTQDQGLLHVRDGKTDRYTQADGLSGDFIVSLFEDREGSIWASTLNGIDRFRDVSVRNLSTEHGLSSNTVMSVLAARDGSVWFGTVAGLNRWKDGRITQHRLQFQMPTESVGSLFQDASDGVWAASPLGLFSLQRDGSRSHKIVDAQYVDAIAEDRTHSVWVSDAALGLLRLRERSVVQAVPWSKIGGKTARALTADSSGGMWLGFTDGGISLIKDGSVLESYSTAEGLAHGTVTNFHFDLDGVLWAASEGGLSRIANRRVATLTSTNGLPCDMVHWVVEDGLRSLWLHTPCGLVRILRNELNAWVTDPARTPNVTVFSHSDGVVARADLGSFTPKVTTSRDGRIWFAALHGVGVLDPQRLPFNKLPPPVHIELVTADRTAYVPSPQLRLPALVRDVRIDYTALSLVAPEKVRFRYKLEGRDDRWVDAGDRRQAFYTDLPPRQYRFRVTAANNDGVWNEEAAAWEFSIQPAFYQTSPFWAGCALLVVAAVGGAYRVRVRQQEAALQSRFDERLAERTRIAQALHDTLLQGFVSSSMQLHVLADQVHDPRVKTTLARILHRMRQVIEEGRQTVSGLRAESSDPLEQVLARDAEALRGQQAVDVHVLVAGARRPIVPGVRDCVYLIAREALANALRHAGANRVDVELEYASGYLRVHVSDDGCGIRPEVIEFGKAGHWGVSGMRERAEHIGATLRLRSRVNGGTEVELHVPDRIAYVTRPPA